jgi:phage shock protein PspC (stress-responsive transcriptional regulator)
MTMTDPSATGRPGPDDVPPVPPTPPPPGFGVPPGAGQPRGQRWLRRSRTDRMVSGVAGGLGEYFGVDPVIFRVLFAVLSFFGGVGLLMYGLAWLLIPEPDVSTSALDRAIGQLRARRVPPWLVLIGGAIVLWLGWFSWWSPGPTFPALMLLAIVLLVLINRLGRSAPPPWVPGTPGATPAGAGPATADEDAADTAAVAAAGAEPGSPENPTLEWAPPGAGTPGGGSGASRLIPPLNDTRRSMQAWIAEAGAAHRERVRRRRPIKVGVAVCLAIAWALVGLIDAASRVAFPAYLWVGLAVLCTGLAVSVLTRRTTGSLLVPIAVLLAVAFALGGTRTSLTDGSGQQGWKPAAADQLVDHRQFAGQTTLDLTALSSLSTTRTVHLQQAAGEVRVLLPAGLNATVVADVHLGAIDNGRDFGTGQQVSGMNVHSELRPPAGTTGQPLTIYVKLSAGHVLVERATG